MSAIVIGLARGDEVSALPGIELRAASLFAPEDLAPELAVDTTALSVYAQAQAEDSLLVARDGPDRVVGFVHLVWLGGIAHVEEIDVEPAYGRRGIGRALVGAACDWANQRGSPRITLSTFRSVAWNAPFYARLGFAEISEDDLSEDLRKLREHEERDGLDSSKRVMMVRNLSDSTSG